ncbi:MAG: hypothetical protein ACK5MQ_09375 [Pikeienuella sp.]
MRSGAALFLAAACLASPASAQGGYETCHEYEGGTWVCVDESTWAVDERAIFLKTQPGGVIEVWRESVDEPGIHEETDDAVYAAMLAAVLAEFRSGIDFPKECPEAAE